MNDQQKITNFAQSVYLARTNRYFDDITEEDGQTYITQVVDFLNQFLDELELEADWNYARANDFTIGTASSATATYPLPTGVRKLVASEWRPLVIMQGGIVVSTWDVVSPNMITRSPNPEYNKRVTFVGGKVIFSRALNSTEIGGTIVADVILTIPRVVFDITAPTATGTTTAVLDLVKPRQLLVLGVAKNATLPDIVQGPISPNIAQNYNAILAPAIAENVATAGTNPVSYEDYSGIGGVY